MPHASGGGRVSARAGGAGHAAFYARADLIAGTILWLVALAAVVLIFSMKSNAYYRHEAVQG